MTSAAKRQKTKLLTRHEAARRRVHAALAVVYELGAPVSAFQRKALIELQCNQTKTMRHELQIRAWRRQVMGWWRALEHEWTGNADVDVMFSNLLLDDSLHSAIGLRLAAVQVSQLAVAEET